MRVVNQQVPTPFRDINMGTVLRPNYGDFAKAPALLPLRALGVVRELATNIGNVGLMDLVFGLAEGLPSGMYDGDGDRALPARGARATPIAPTTSASSRTSST